LFLFLLFQHAEIFLGVTVDTFAADMKTRDRVERSLRALCGMPYEPSDDELGEDSGSTEKETEAGIGVGTGIATRTNRVTRSTGTDLVPRSKIINHATKSTGTNRVIGTDRVTRSAVAAISTSTPGTSSSQQSSQSSSGSASGSDVNISHQSQHTQQKQQELTLNLASFLNSKGDLKLSVFDSRL
jgi:hypothetical protein